LQRLVLAARRSLAAWVIPSRRPHPMSSSVHRSARAARVMASRRPRLTPLPTVLCSQRAAPPAWRPPARVTASPQLRLTFLPAVHRS